VIEKTANPKAGYQKKILPYIDGTLNPGERADFEAYVATHPEFEALVKEKQQEVSFLRDLMPSVSLSPEAKESLESEIKQSIFNLLNEEPKNFMDKMKNRFEEWANR